MVEMEREGILRYVLGIVLLENMLLRFFCTKSRVK